MPRRSGCYATSKLGRPKGLDHRPGNATLAWQPRSPRSATAPRGESWIAEDARYGGPAPAEQLQLEAELRTLQVTRSCPRRIWPRSRPRCLDPSPRHDARRSRRRGSRTRCRPAKPGRRSVLGHSSGARRDAKHMLKLSCLSRRIPAGGGAPHAAGHGAAGGAGSGRAPARGARTDRGGPARRVRVGGGACGATGRRRLG